MASVSGSQLSFVSPNEKPVHIILSDDAGATTVAGAFNIEVFTSGSGTPLLGVDATATIGGAVSLTDSEVQAKTLGSVEQLGVGKFTLVDHTGGEDIILGSGAQTVVGSSGDTIVGGDAVKGSQEIDLTGTNSGVTAGPMTAVGGAGPVLVEAGTGDSITGGSGSLTVTGGASDTIVGGSGPTTVLGGSFRRGEFPGDHLARVTGQIGGETGKETEDDARGADDRDAGKSRGDDSFGDDDQGRGDDDKGRGDDDETGSGAAVNDTIIGGAGSMAIFGGSGDSITGGSGSLLVEGVSGSTVSAGTGGTTVVGGDGDVITDSVAGSLVVDIESRDWKHGEAPSIPGSGSETVDLSAGHGATTLRDVSVPGGTGDLAATSVTGFSTTTDVIASKTSVSPSGEFLGTSTNSGSDTTLTFLDGSTMTLAGITDVSQLTFTR